MLSNTHLCTIYFQSWKTPNFTFPEKVVSFNFFSHQNDRIVKGYRPKGFATSAMREFRRFSKCFKFNNFNEKIALETRGINVGCLQSQIWPLMTSKLPYFNLVLLHILKIMKKCLAGKPSLPDSGKNDREYLYFTSLWPPITTSNDLKIKKF